MVTLATALQRELRHQITRCATVVEIGALVSSFVHVMEPENVVICHTQLADRALSHGTPVDVAILQILWAAMEPDLRNRSSGELSSVLWSWAEVAEADRSEVLAAWLQSPLEAVAAVGLQLLPHHSTGDLTTVAWAYGAIAARRHGAIVPYVAHVAAELVGRMADRRERADFSPSNIADIVQAFARLSVLPHEQPARFPPSSHRPEPEVEALLDVVAGLVVEELSQKHSGRATFRPASLVVLVNSYAQLGHYNTQVRVLFAAATWLQGKDGV